MELDIEKLAEQVNAYAKENYEQLELELCKWVRDLFNKTPKARIYHGEGHAFSIFENSEPNKLSEMETVADFFQVPGGVSISKDEANGLTVYRVQDLADDFKEKVGDMFLASVRLSAGIDYLSDLTDEQYDEFMQMTTVWNKFIEAFPQRKVREVFSLANAKAH